MEVDCVGVVSKSSSGSFVVVVVLEDFVLLLWSSWRMVSWCWNERGNFFGTFQSDFYLFHLIHYFKSIICT